MIDGNDPDDFRDAGGDEPSEHDLAEGILQDIGVTARDDDPHPEPSWPMAGAEEPEATSAAAPRPFLADDVWRPVNESQVSVRRLSGLLSAAIMSGLGLLGLSIWWATGPGMTAFLLSGGGWALFASYLIAQAIIWPRLSWRRLRWRLDDRRLEIRRGVWWHSNVTVPLTRIQHTDVTRGPIERRFDVASLVVHTAGTESATIFLSGLTEEDANAVRDHLLTTSRADGV